VHPHFGLVVGRASDDARERQAPLIRVETRVETFRLVTPRDTPGEYRPSLAWPPGIVQIG
jgi:hypothetical protein